VFATEEGQKFETIRIRVRVVKTLKSGCIHLGKCLCIIMINNIRHWFLYERQVHKTGDQVGKVPDCKKEPYRKNH